jgi:hypothetical protein
VHGRDISRINFEDAAIKAFRLLQAAIPREAGSLVD